MWINFGSYFETGKICDGCQFILFLDPYALPFFHAFTGCDAVSAFVEKDKRTAWHAWNALENATEVCHYLNSLCDNLPENEIGVFEEFNCCHLV